jgi:hypothetical protein
MLPYKDSLDDALESLTGAASGTSSAVPMLRAFNILMTKQAIQFKTVTQRSFKQWTLGTLSAKINERSFVGGAGGAGCGAEGGAELR